MIKGVIFDMDGVLVDNLDMHMKAFELFAARHGTILKTEIIDNFFGRGNDEIMPAICPKELLDKVDMHVLSAEKESIYRDIYRNHVVPTAGLVPFLKELNRDGLHCAVGSSGSKENVDFIVSECGIADCFDVLVDGGMVAKRKPAPDIFLRAAQLLGIEPCHCVVFEDSVAGIRAARSAGMKVVGVATTMTREQIEAQVTPDRIVSDFTKITPSELQSL